MIQPVRVLEFRHTIARSTQVIVENYTSSLPENLWEWSEKDAMEHNVLSARILYHEGHIVLGIMVSDKIEQPLYPMS